MNPGSLATPPPGSGPAQLTTAVQVIPSGGFTGAVTFSLLSPPAWAAGSFNPASSPSGSALTLAIDTTGLSPGTQTLVIRGSSPGFADATAALTLTVPQGPSRNTGIVAVEDQCRTLWAQNPQPAAFLQSVAGVMAGRNEYASTGVTLDGLCAWGLMKDGSLHIVAANRDPWRPPGGIAPTAMAAAGGAISPSSNARLLHAFGANFEGQAPIDDVAGWLRSAGWTLRAGQEGDARLATLKTVAGDGFFYINCHGGRVEIPGPGGTEKVYALQSSTLQDDNLEKIPEYKDDLAAHRIVHFTARNGDTKSILGISYADWDTRYGITASFVQRYMSFARDSIVFINACFSSRNSEFIFACQQKGASVVLGWSEKLTSDTAYTRIRYFADRVLGANQYQKESPNQRPFPWDLVLQDMQAKGLTLDPGSGGMLLGMPASQSGIPPILAPSIRLLVVDEWARELKLLGYFGENPGKVTVDGNEVAVKSWAPDEVLCDLPDQASGDVQVKVRELKSNLRQLSEWRVPLHYTWNNFGDLAGLKFDGSATIRYRLDVGAFRRKPGGALVYPQRGTMPTRDSSLPVTGSGSAHVGPPTEDCTVTLSGSGAFPTHNPNPGSTPDFILLSPIRIDPQAKTGSLGLAFGMKSQDISPWSLAYRGRDCSGDFKTTPAFGLLQGPANLPYTQEENSMELPLPALNLAFGNDFTLQPPAGGAFTDSSLGGTLRITWTSVTPKSPPKEDSGK
ncbi:MAG: hypothetical protein HY823_02330 [Acidobacteria bacterium]|nr:hypothetical protein [Acidobacteriota bacterium]